jgi:hypothetical protein
MGDHEHKAPAKCTTVKWGAVIAGAAVVAGALLFAPALAPVGAAIASLFTSSATAVATTAATAAPAVAATGTGVGTAAIEAITALVSNPLTQRVGGAALLGGGAAYFLGGEKEAPHAHHEALAHENRESFAMTEDMRKTQMKMMIQAAAAGNPQAQAMMSQMQGRG